MPDTIKKLTDLFAKFPTIGPRTAGRFVFYLIKQPKASIDELVNTLQALQANVKFCSFCFNPFEGQGTLCPICQNPSRNRQVLCIVEKESDLISIEQTKRYDGLYVILGGVLDMKNNRIEDLRIEDIMQRIIDPPKFGLPLIQFSEIIIGLNPTPEGRSTASAIERTLKELQSARSLSFKITYLARGLPFGGELEYADEETLEEAFGSRREIKKAD